MWCARCNMDYDGLETCPICGETLRTMPKPGWGRAVNFSPDENWPIGEDGNRIEPAFLTHGSNLNLHSEMLISMLGAYGIPCVVKYPNNGDFGKIIFGISAGGSDIFVPETMLEDAQALLKGDEND